MRFGLADEQRMLGDSVRRLLAAESSLAIVRATADAGAPYAAQAQRGLADLGVLGLLIPERFGGVGLNLLDAALVAEALGYAVAPVAFTATAVIAPLALTLAGSETQQQEWLPRIAAGEAVIAAAIGAAVERREDAGVRAGANGLNGKALFALEWPSSDACLVLDELGSLHLVGSNAPGIAARELPTVDRTRRTYELCFTNTPAQALPGSTPEVVTRLIDAARIVLAADSLGAAQCMLDKAVAYAKEREQFGRTIASFQAVKHMCAEMAAQLEPCRALLWQAAHTFSDSATETTAQVLAGHSHTLACHSKAHTDEVGRHVARTATEVHGGMGFTDLLGLHYWFKRIGFARQLYGGPERVREEAARAQGWLAA